jgi:SAM-dependent methyltransferase
MKERWDERATRDAFHYVETELWRGDVETFFAVGEQRAQTLVDPVLEAHVRNDRRQCAVELGCGVGRFSRALSRRFEDVVGVDVSEEMVRHARELHPSDSYPRLRFVAGDGMSMPMDDAAADFVFSYEVFQHMPSRDVIKANLRDIARVLRPDGVALIHVRTARSALRRRAPRIVRIVKARLAGVEPLKRDATFLGTALGRDELVGLFASAGLRVDDVQDDPTHDPGERALVVARRADV